MSWIVTTLLITLAMFALFFMLSEWIARRNGGGGDDPSATG